MKKLLFLFILISSCKKEVYYYPSKSFFEERNPKEIIFENLSFQEITDSISNGLFKKERYYLTLIEDNKQYKISPFTYTGGFIREKNALEIIKDSIYISVNKFPMTELSQYLKIHFENNGKVDYLSDSYKRAFIKLVLDKDSDALKLQDLLLQIIKTFNETNIKHKEKIDLAIMFVYPFDQMFSIPPPPSPITIEK
jgi:hypothetical protein